MGLPDWLTSPRVLFFAAIVAILLWDIRAWGKREDALWALCRKYGLRMGVDWMSAPDPGIRGWFFPATYTKYIEGRISGVPVVAFDFTIGIGKNKRYGSGVGVKRMAPNAETIARGMKSRQIEGWTFVYSALHAFNAEPQAIGGRVRADVDCLAGTACGRACGGDVSAADGAE